MKAIELLRKIESDLRAQHASGDPMPRHLAGAHAHVLGRLLEQLSQHKGFREALDAVDAADKFGVQQREFYVGLCYRIRRELAAIQGTKRAADIDAAETARAWKCGERSPRQYATDKRLAIDDYLKRLDWNIAYDGMSRAEKLAKELEYWEPSAHTQKNQKR